MRKVLLLLCFVSMSAVMLAQEDAVTEDKHSVKTNRFWSNWFVQGDVTWNAFYAAGGGRRVLTAPFHKFPTGGGAGYTGLGASLAIGKWFTPGLGLRTKVNAWRLGSKPDGGGDPDQYWAANEQVLVNLSNLLMGYNEYRVWNFIPFFGAGINRNMSQDHYSTQLSFGLLNTFRISRRVWVNAEIGWNSWEANNTGIGLKKRHQQLTAELGLTFGLGKSRWKKVTDSGASNALLQGELDALNAQLEDALAENNRLQNELANQPKATAAVSTAAPKVVTKVVAAPVSVFFTVGKAVVSKKDLQNVSALAEVAKQNNAQLKVTGFADSKTGSAEYNQRLSQQRAEAVADALVQMGVERGQIEVVAAGGVDTLNPFDYNRRAVVEIK